MLTVLFTIKFKERDICHVYNCVDYTNSTIMITGNLVAKNGKLEVIHIQLL